MGIFRQNFDRPGPGVAKDAPRKKGAARFFEILGRDAGSLFKAGLLVGLAYIPVGIFVGFGLFSLSMPVTLLAAGVGGLLTGPLLAGLYDTVMRALRDEPGYWWHTYKRAMKANWKQAMIAGVVLNLLVGARVCAGWDMLLGAMQESLAFLAGVGLNVMVTAMVATCLFPQMVVMDVPMLTLFKNALFCTVGFAPRVLAASLLQIAWWVLFLLFMPVSAILVPFMGFWPIVLIATLIIYKPLEKALDLEARLAARREQQAGEE